MSATAPPAAPVAPVAPPPAKPPRSPVAIAARFAVSGLLLLAYFALYGTIIGQLTAASLTFTAAKVIAVTGLGMLLVATWWAVIKRDIRFQAPILITYILAVGDATFGILESHTSSWLTAMTGGRITGYSPTFVAIVVTTAFDMILARIIRGKWPHLASAYITGISVGILVKSPSLQPFILCALLSIASKYVLRMRDRHLWNPSNFGITILLFFASLAGMIAVGTLHISGYWDMIVLWLGSDVATLSVQAGNEIWPVLLIWTLGSLILYRLKRLHIPITFIAAFLPLALLRSAITDNPWRAELAPMTWPMFQLYIFFMITDPATTTKRRWSQCVVVVLVAVVETILRLTLRDVHSLYHALFIVGPATNLVEILLTRKAKKPGETPPGATPRV